MSIEAMKQALEALENHTGNYKLSKDECVKYTAIENNLRQAIAEAEKQEPVAWMYPDALCDRNCLYLCTKGFMQFPECASSPPQRQWVRLTDEELDSYREQRWWSAVDMAKEVEAKLKEKNNG